MILRSETYVDDLGRRVDVRFQRVADGEPLTIQYIGHYKRAIAYDIGGVRIKTEFAHECQIDASSLEEAFAKLDAAMQSDMLRRKSEMSRPRLVVAGALDGRMS